jgi:multiple sugar transport system permease protein
MRNPQITQMAQIRPAGMRRHARPTGVILHIILALGAVTMILPFLWMLSTSLKPESQIFRFPPVWIPSQWQWSNYTEAMEAAPFGRYFLNTAIFATAVTISNLLFCSMAAYAFARLHFRGRDLLFILVLGTMMIPGQVTMVPVFIMLKHWPLAGGNDLLGAGGHGLLNSFTGLVLPGAVGAFGIFLLRQFFMTLPRELEDAARIDGCSEAGIYWRIILPLSRPALATLGIFTFTAAWNEFLWPLLIMSKDSMKTLQVGLQVFQTQYVTRWDLLMAGTVVITLPVLIIFLAGQRYFTRGIALSGIKG